MNPCVRRPRVVPVALALLLSIGATAALAAPKAFVDPTEIDLGVIEQGKLFERYVDVKNVGDGLLVIEDLKTSCGCTAAAVDGASELTAGKTQRVRVTFNSKNMDGPVKKTVTLTTNDPEQKHFEIALRADVHRSVRFVPKYLELRDVPMKGAWEETVRLESDVPLNMKVKEAYVLGGRLRNEPSQLFDVDATGSHREADRDVQEYVVRLRTPAKPQKLSEVLTFVTDQPAPDDTLRVAIRGEVVGRIRASSSFLVIRSVDPGEKGTQEVRLTSEEGPFHVTGASVPNSDVKATVAEADGNKQAIVTLEYTGKEPGDNGVRTLIIQTDDADQDTMEIPVRFSTKMPGQPQTPAELAGKPPVFPTATPMNAPMANPAATPPGAAPNAQAPKGGKTGK